MDYRLMLVDLATLHHAYAIEGGAQEAAQALLRLSELGFDHIGHPDALVREYEQFGIDESRELTLRVSRKPLLASRSIIVITTPTMTVEAQQALLKTLEDPGAQASVFIVIPSIDTLLPTLRSRLQLLWVPRQESEDDGSAAAFVSATPKDRLKQLEPMLKERRVGEVLAFLASLERTLASDIENKDARRGLRAVYRARAHCTDKGALLKILLEQVALLTPVR